MQRAGTQGRSPRGPAGKMTRPPGAPPQLERMLTGVRAAGLKLTPQRLAIVRELAEDESHPTAQELFERLRPGLPTMSFATVYNTLDALTAAGLCSALALSPGSGRFDPNMRPHHHLVCDGCGSVRDLPIPGPAEATGEMPRAASRAASHAASHGAFGDASDLPVGDASVRRAIARAAPGFEVRSVERILRGLCADCGRGRSAARGERR